MRKIIHILIIILLTGCVSEQYVTQSQLRNKISIYCEREAFFKLKQEHGNFNKNYKYCMLKFNYE